MLWEGVGGGGLEHTGRAYRRPPETWGRSRVGNKGVHTACGAPRPQRKGSRKTFQGEQTQHTQTVLSILSESTVHNCVINLKILTKQNYGKYKSQKLDEDVEPCTAKHSWRRLQSPEAPLPPGGLCGAEEELKKPACRRAPGRWDPRVRSNLREHTHPCAHPSTHSHAPREHTARVGTRPQHTLGATQAHACPHRHPHPSSPAHPARAGEAHRVWPLSCSAEMER